MSKSLLPDDVRERLRAAGCYPVKPHFYGGKEAGKRALKRWGLWNPDFE